ncbi:hypothetical protein D3C83_194880 [compost metagenome]
MLEQHVDERNDRAERNPAHQREQEREEDDPGKEPRMAKNTAQEPCDRAGKHVRAG